MKTRKRSFGTISFIAALLLSTIAFSCNSNGDEPSYQYSTVSYSSTAVTAFSLSSAPKVLNKLDSVFFSIDLESARIFNATPLPYETNISALLLNISTDNCSTVEINYTTKWGNDTTIDYLKSSTDSINFAEGPVVLHVVSYDKTAQRDYNITVNVYEENPDSLVWVKQASVLPADITSATKAKSVQAANKYYQLVEADGTYRLTCTDNLFYFSAWQQPVEVDFPGFTPQIESFTGALDGSLYILSTDNMLYTSTDGGSSWTSTGQSMSHIYGTYENIVLGNTISGGSLFTLSYPGGSQTEQPDYFPASATSSLVTNYSQWEVNPLAVMSGGITSSGEYSADTWAFDGNKWARISTGTLEAAAGRSIFKYEIAETDSTNWRVIYRPVIMNFGGRNAQGEVLSTVYYSTDMGVHWTEAPLYMQLPEEFPIVSGAQYFVEDDMLSVGSRAVTPVTEWLCPFIYMLDGYDDSGTLNTSTWQGVFNRYTLVPLQ